MRPSSRAIRLAAGLSRLFVVAGLAWIAASIIVAPRPVDAATASPTPTPAGNPTAAVYVVTATGVVDNVLAGYIDESIRLAAANDAPAVVITLNTPGGSLDSTQRIVSSLLGAPLPTIVWVAPSGGRAASAGTFITLAAHLAYMAPGTNIGAASPVGAGGEDIPGTLGEKVRNDAIANIRSIAETRGRNAEWAIEAVRDARSSAASEAVALGVVDGIATSLDDVLTQANGQTVDVNGREVTVATAGAPVEELPMNPFQAFLHLLSDGNVAALLFTIGSLGLLYELANPNFVTGILGALAIILAFIGFGSLPLNVAGLLLIALAMLLFMLELTVTSHGLLAVGGLICFFLGASALYTAPGSPTAPEVQVAPEIIVAMTVSLAAFMAIAATTIVRARRRTLAFAGAYGAGGVTLPPPGTPGVVRATIDGVGIVYAAGEDWSARCVDGCILPQGAPVRVVGQEGLMLIVEPATEA